MMVGYDSYQMMLASADLVVFVEVCVCIFVCIHMCELHG